MTGIEGPQPGPPRRRHRRAPWIVAAVAVPAVLLLIVMAASPPANTRVTRSPLLGKPAPNISAQTIDNTHFDLASLRGQWVLVNFFATWCVPCRKETPELAAFHRRHQATGDLSVVGVIFQDSTDAVLKFRETDGGDWPMVLDPKGPISVAFGVAAVPESFLIAPDGTVVSKIVGGVTEARLEALLVQAQGGS